MRTLTFEVHADISSMKIEGAAALLGCQIEEYVDAETSIFRRLTGPCLESKTGNPTRNIERWPEVLVEVDVLKSRIRELEERDSGGAPL